MFIYHIDTVQTRQFHHRITKGLFRSSIEQNQTKNVKKSKGNKVRWASEIWVPVVVPMAKLKTIVSMEAGQTRCSVDESSTRSGSFETTNNFKLVVFDRNILAIIFFLALFLLSITLVRSFNFVFHQKLMKIFFRLVSYYSILSALPWRHFTQKVGESLCRTHFLVSSTAKPEDTWLMTYVWNLV